MLPEEELAPEPATSPASGAWCVPAAAMAQGDGCTGSARGFEEPDFDEKFGCEPRFAHPPAFRSRCPESRCTGRSMTSPLAELAAAAATAADAPPPAPGLGEAASEPPAKRRKARRGSAVDAATSRLTSAQLQLNVLLATVQQVEAMGAAAQQKNRRRAERARAALEKRKEEVVRLTADLGTRSRPPQTPLRELLQQQRQRRGARRRRGP